MVIEDLLEEVLSVGASDLHLSLGKLPMVRLGGQMTRFDSPEIGVSYRLKELDMKDIILKTQKSRVNISME